MLSCEVGESCVSHAVALPASSKMKYRLELSLLVPAVCEPSISFT